MTRCHREKNAINILMLLLASKASVRKSLVSVRLLPRHCRSVVSVPKTPMTHSSMHNKKTAYALFLSILVILVYVELVITPMRPQETTLPRAVALNAAEAPAGAPTQSPQPVSYQAVGATTTPVVQSGTQVEATKTDAASVEEALKTSPTLVIKNGGNVSTISLLGGRLISHSLGDFKKELKGDASVDLVNAAKGNYPLGFSIAGVSDVATSYSVVAASSPANSSNSSMSSNGLVSEYQVPESGELTLTLSGVLSNGTTITKLLRFVSNSYLIALDIQLTNSTVPGQPSWLEWTESTKAIGVDQYNPSQFVRLNAEGALDRVVPTAIEAPLEQASKWIAFSDNYFASALIAETASRSVLEKRVDHYSFRIEGSPNGGRFEVYAGPKRHEDLERAGHQLTRTVDLGWFGFVGQPILLLLDFLYGVLGNYGLAIIALTLLVKTALLPLSKTGFESMKKMQDLQPELAALKERVKDQAQLQQEMMALYKRRGVNPMGGCLPMMLQIPIFLGMYNGLRSSIELRHAPFALWIKDLASPESLNIGGVPVPVMILLMGASMILQQVTTPSTGDPQQRKIMMLAPVIFTVMFVVYPFPAGLVLYMLVNNTVSVLQQGAMKGSKGLSALNVTLLGGAAVFGTGFVLTLL
jgi:YidC/Oxa1 family membrane protein insertase